MQCFNTDWTFYISIYKYSALKLRQLTILLSAVDYLISLKSLTMVWEVLWFLCIKMSLNIIKTYWEGTHLFIA